ncbi:MAG: hypothetical protein Q9162_006267 [Coniocarpon cinnabarinum]
MAEATEGVFAIKKPVGPSSAQVIRDLSAQFNKSRFFKPWIDAERARLNNDPSHVHNKKRWKRRNETRVKMGHGGTLDPSASGVLIVGVGRGTKELAKFLECTKSYEAVVLFGAATRSYDDQDAIIGRRPFSHITRERCEEALARFRGKIKQKPPIFSALKMDGKKLYEYAREGIEPPREIEKRDVDVSSLEMLEWMDGGTHEYRWPDQEAEASEKQGALKMLGKDGQLEITEAENMSKQAAGEPLSTSKRKRDSEEGDATEDGEKDVKRMKETSEPAAGEETTEATEVAAAPATKGEDTGVQSEGHSSNAELPVRTKEASSSDAPPNVDGTLDTNTYLPAPPQPPAARIRMTVSGGFYVRSFCHDLGLALDSFGLMSHLIRLRQGDFELDNQDVLQYDDLQKGEEVWAPKVKRQLKRWNDRSRIGAF